MAVAKRFRRVPKALRILLYIVALILFLELSSMLVLNHLISPTRLERFDDIFLTDQIELDFLPHPYLGLVTSYNAMEQERYLSHLSRNRSNIISVVALGGSTTAWGYPAHTENYLNRKLMNTNSSRVAVVFNFGVPSWTSFTSLQNYVYVVRYLHPDFVVIHHNINDRNRYTNLFRQTTLKYPKISSLERAFLRGSRFYRLLRIAYAVSYNPLRYGKAVIFPDKAMLPTEARISSYLNENNASVNPYDFFDTAFTVEFHQHPSFPLEFLLTETYESLIGYTKADNTTLIITTQYLNHSKIHKRAIEGVEKDKRESHEINNILREVSKQYQVPLVDLDREMEPFDHLLQEDGVHFQEEGIKIKGELIGEAIFEILEERYNLSSQQEPNVNGKYINRVIIEILEERYNLTG